MTPNDTPLTLAQTAQKFGITERTLRYYEYIELIVPPKKGRKRLYGVKEFARITLVLRGRKFGFSLEDLRRWLLLYDTEGPIAQLERFIALADQKINELSQEKNKLDEAMEEMRELKRQSIDELKRAKL